VTTADDALRSGSVGGLPSDTLCAASVDIEAHHGRIDEFGVPPASTVHQTEATT
jgi:hypothetical protein